MFFNKNSNAAQYHRLYSNFPLPPVINVEAV